jgi:hypothetical protein
VILFYINQFMAALRKIFGAPPPPPIPQEDINEPCPCCGHTNGMIRGIQENGRFMLQHVCKVCGAVWNKLPIIDQLGLPRGGAPIIKTEVWYGLEKVSVSHHRE